MTDPRLDELDLHRLIATYADGVTRRDWDGLGALFDPDAVLHLDLVDRGARDLVGPTEILGFISASVERFDFFEFVALNVLVTVPAGVVDTGETTGETTDVTTEVVFDADTARLRTNMCEIRHHRNDGPYAGDVGSGGWSTAFGIYQDTAVRSDGMWRFAHRSYRSLARTDPVASPGGIVLPFPDLPRRP